jgi:hypothetical protein
VEEFWYLGRRITIDGRNKKGIFSRITQAKMAFYQKRRLLTTYDANLEVGNFLP